jgi:hypothetical protein
LKPRLAKLLGNAALDLGMDGLDVTRTAIRSVSSVKALGCP